MAVKCFNISQAIVYHKMKNKNVVLQITPFFRPDTGGMQTHLDNLCEYLRKRGWYTYVCTYQPLKLKIRLPILEKKGNLEVHRVNWIRGNWANIFENNPPMRFLYLTVALLIYCFWFMLFNHKKIKVIHAHGINAGFIAVILKIFFKKRIILSTHSVYDESIGSTKKFIKKFVNPVLLNIFDKILTISDESTKELIEVGVKKEKLQRYTHWVNQDIFRPYNRDRVRKELNLNYEKIVLFVGRLVSTKGIELLIKVARKLKEIDFVFIGNGPLSHWIKMQDMRMKNVHYLGKVENSNLPKYYSAADLLCVPSLCKEGYGRVILEAISCGVPVIGSKVSGLSEVINEKIGVLFEPEVKNIKNGILHILKSYEKYSKNCFEYSREKYSDNNARIIIDAYLNSE